MPVKKGALTQAELFQIWKSMVDPSYARPLIEKPESGVEAIKQAHAQLALVSESVDVTTQAMFILPWSGQTAAPAQGRGFAKAVLTATRTELLQYPLILSAATVVKHLQVDFAENAGVELESGRVYLVDQNVVFGPGIAGPLDVAVTAENPGHNYNLPLPGTLTRIDQPGAGFSNVDGSVVPGVATHAMVAGLQPDVVVPQHVGQHLRFTGGANAGQVRRIVGFVQAEPDVNGGTLLIDADGVYGVTGVTGTFIAGEELVQTTSGARARVVYSGAGVMVAARIDATFTPGLVITGVSSGATATVGAVDRSPDLTAETGTAGWKVLDWEEDFGLTVTNAESPTGGLAPWLDELGNERDVPRAPAEGDGSYRQRVATPADVVSPNAIRRAANRILAPLGFEGVLREAGYPDNRGLFFDGPPDQDMRYSFFWDLDSVRLEGTITGPGFIEGELCTHLRADGTIVTGRAVMASTAVANPPEPHPGNTFWGIANVRGGQLETTGEVVGRTSGTRLGTITTISGGLNQEHRFHTWFDLVDYRGFFLMGVPRLGGDDFGFGWDEGGIPFFDSTPAFTFFDGYSMQAVAIYSAIWQTIDPAKAGGVGFDLVEEYDLPGPQED